MSSDDVVYTCGYQNDVYHIDKGCKRFPEDPRTMRKSVAVSWDTLTLCKHCTGVGHTGLYRDNTDDIGDDDPVVISARNELYHIPDRCEHQPGNPDTLDRGEAKSRGYRMCKFCDPTECPTSSTNHPESELPAQIREADTPEVSGDD
jgi:hypothetical protein